MGRRSEIELDADRQKSSAHAEELLRSADVLADQGKWEKALELYESIVEFAPDLPNLHTKIADAHAELERWQPAAQSYLAAIEREPNNPLLFLKLGDLLELCGDNAGAKRTYRQGLARVEDPRFGAAGVNLPITGRGESRAAYLDLMKDCLTFLLWGAADGEAREFNLRQPMVTLVRLFRRMAPRARATHEKVRESGKDWPSRALTMVGRHRLDNVQECIERVLQDGVPGDLIETGVWRGGGAIFMRAVLRAYGDHQRKVWVADSFAGVPPPNAEDYPADRGYDLSTWRTLAISAEEVRENFRRFHLLDEQVAFLEGWFSETLPSAPITDLAVMRLDGDLYESTMDGLVHLYSRLSRGGFVIVDDYFNSPPCRQAVDEFRNSHSVEGDLVQADWSAAFWRKQ